MAYAYAVEYLRNGKPDRFITLDKTAADDYAVRWDGVIYELEKTCHNNPSMLSSMINAEDCLLQQQTVM